MSLLSALPLPVRIVLLVLGGFLLFQVARDYHTLLVVLALVLWGVVLIGLLYAAGMLNGLARVPVLAPALGALTRGPSVAAPAPGAAGSAAQPTGPAEPVQERALTDDEREALIARAESTFDRLVGVDDAIAAIDQRLLEPARAAQARGEPGFGSSAPALVAILAGPRGVGKTEMARAVAQLYAGSGLLKTGKVAVLRQRDVKAGFGGAAAETARQIAEGALDGALLIDDADWLVETDPTFQATPGVDAGRAILEVAQAHPQRLLVLLTMSAAAERRLRADPRHATWLDRLTVRSIEIAPLSDDTLVDVVRRHLERRDHGVEPEAEGALRRMIRERRDTVGSERFDNAEACRRIADDVIEAALLRSAHARAGSTADGLTIAREDVQKAMEDGA